MFMVWLLFNFGKLIVGILCEYNYDKNLNINLNIIGNVGK